ncbi:MAG: carbohydrate-binding domain-containing protein, partial [Lachnospiraceae bacterium]|nr:carbohydrate-binding domain-containing protein [Lachnospiraceae bacterium]
MKQNFKRKLLAGVLSVCMIFQTAGMVPVYAVENGADSGTSAGTSTVCENHTEHDEACGYVEGTKGSPCTHEHTEDCYVEVEKCIHEHTDECYPDTDDEEATGSEAKEPTECSHITCDEASGCITKELDCQHEHDEECGYVEAGKGSPCTHTCELCAKDGEEDVEEIIKEDTELATDSNAQAVSEENIKEVQALIDALPTLEALKEITDKEEQKAIYDDLQTAYEAYKALTKEEQAEVTGAEVFESLFDWFNNQVAIATDVVTYPSWEAATAAGDALKEDDKITIDDVTYTYKGDGSTGISLVEGEREFTAVQGKLVWKAGGGYVLYSYSGTQENPGKASVTLHGATIKTEYTALKLPCYQYGPELPIGVDTTVSLEGTNRLSGKWAIYHSAGDTSFTGSGTLELSSTNEALDLADFEISGGAEVTIQSGTNSQFTGSLTVGAGSKLTIDKGAKLRFVSMDATTLTIETGGTLENSGTLALWMASGLTIENSGTLANNGTIQLPLGTTTDNIKGMKFSGSGTVQVHNDEQQETFDTYTNDGEKLIISTTALNFTNVTTDQGNLENDGYTWEGDATGGYTLTLGNLNLTAGNPIILPDADVGIVLKGKTTLNAEQPGIYSTGTASGHTVTISGDGSLSTTSENNKGIHIVQNLSITGGTLDMKGRAGGIYSNGDIEISGGTITGNTIESYDGALTISGGTVDVSGTNNSGITAYTNITISGGTVTAASTDYIGIASSGTITISGGTVTATSAENTGIYAIEAVDISGGSVTAKGGKTAIWSFTGITLTGMRITNPAGAAVGDSVNDAPGKAIMLNGKDVLDVTIGEIKLEFKGEGTEASPYEISTAKELADLAAAVNNGKADYISAHYKLMNNLDLSGIASWTPIGTYVIGNAEATKPFKGTFDGNGKTIRNLKINAPSAI